MSCRFTGVGGIFCEILDSCFGSGDEVVTCKLHEYIHLANRHRSDARRNRLTLPAVCKGLIDL